MSTHGEELAWRTSSFFFPVWLGRRSVGNRASSSSSSAVLVDYVWVKVRVEPHNDFVMFWGEGQVSGVDGSSADLSRGLCALLCLTGIGCHVVDAAG